MDPTAMTSKGYSTTPDPIEEHTRINPWYSFDVPRVNKLYAWLAVNRETGHEGIIVAQRSGKQMPLIALSMKQAELYEKAAKRVGKAMNVTIRLKVYRAIDLEKAQP